MFSRGSRSWPRGAVAGSQTMQTHSQDWGLYAYYLVHGWMRLPLSTWLYGAGSCSSHKALLSMDRCWITLLGRGYKTREVLCYDTDVTLHFAFFKDLFLWFEWGKGRGSPKQSLCWAWSPRWGLISWCWDHDQSQNQASHAQPTVPPSYPSSFYIWYMLSYCHSFPLKNFLLWKILIMHKNRLK